MEVYNESDTKIHQIYQKSKSWLSTSLGILITVLGVAVIFVVSSLEGTKEIKASNADSATIIEQWREANPNEMFPEEKAELIEFKDKMYYFVVSKRNILDGEILEWYFAYDGGIGYVFSDYKFYVLTLLTVVVSMYVSTVNYASAVRSTMESESFARTLKHYQENKSKIVKYTQYIPDFCIYKNQQTYEMAKRDIIERAGISYDFYTSKELDYKKLDKWQRKILKEIRKIRVKKIKSSDLLQEHGVTSSRIIAILPMSQNEHQRNYFISNLLQKVLSSALGGLTIAFGVVLGNWVLGLTYGFTVLLSYVSSNIVGIDFVLTTLRNRFLAKADLLNEFDNIKTIFIEKNKNIALEKTTLQDEKNV